MDDKFEWQLVGWPGNPFTEGLRREKLNKRELHRRARNRFYLGKRQLQEKLFANEALHPRGPLVTTPRL